MHETDTQHTPQHRIGFVGSRFSGIDGVSLETQKWAEVFSRSGHECFFFAGELDCPPEREYVAPEAHFKHPEVVSLQNVLVHSAQRTPEATEAMHALRRMLKEHLAHFVEVYNIDTIVVENALSLPLNISLGVALTEFLFETGIPVIGHHHDFPWERNAFTHTQAPEYIEMAFPPHTLTRMAHVTIHTQATRALYTRKNIRAVTAPNVMDFKHPPAALSLERETAIRKALAIEPMARIFLHPTRVVPRKEIEISIDILHELLGSNVLLVSHESGDEDNGEYQNYLARYASSKGVDVRFVADRVTECVGKERGACTLAELYSMADMVLYPSLWEGFGNAFVEAVYYRVPILVRRYPVYVSDIAPKGFAAIEYEPGMNMQHLAKKVEHVLKSERTIARDTVHNYTLGMKHFSYEQLDKMLMRILSNIHTTA